ncbi:MAG: FliM/FliN family flagellar motor switch protein [Terracidiphilus sp.]
MAVGAVPAQTAGEAAIVPSNPELAADNQAEEEERWKPVLALPCKLTVDLPLPGFKIADFLNLRPQSVVGAHWRLGHDVPLRLNGTLIGWIEFEAVGDNLAVRLRELA